MDSEKNEMRFLMKFLPRQIFLNSVDIVLQSTEEIKYTVLHARMIFVPQRVDSGFVGCLRNFRHRGKTIGRWKKNNRQGVKPCSDKVEPGHFFGKTNEKTEMYYVRKSILCNVIQYEASDQAGRAECSRLTGKYGSYDLIIQFSKLKRISQ